ncbi:hypothetical protein H2198_007668 [Neophaeococcomyces mojaviensis]|uniref:Uncharacterized protein n=1 Tax=Neophaeococcomyces mojaviensis TaxID=3383035 RepID=A0ACC2ZZM2_9EURO|nr:hypothetical protein H2198_007668 [Knufia sp. JES_112]
MKETLFWTEKTWAERHTLTFFFNARAPGELEKNTLGLYRSLVHQLLSLQASLRPIFLHEFSSKVYNQRVERWTQAELQNFITAVVCGGHLPGLNIFIDALDEGVEENIRDMVQFFANLAEHSVTSGAVFRLCLSSRHYPYISVRKGMSLFLEDQTEHTQDIKIYIQNKLNGNDDQSLENIRQILLQRSAGIFLWVVLVIRILNQVHDRGRGMAAMRTRLESTPQALSDLFTSILTRNQEDFEECITLLRCVLYSVRPLNAVELYLAIKQRHAPADMDESIDWPMQRHNPVGIRELIGWIEHQEVDHFLRTRGEYVSRYILDCSRGLVEVSRDYSCRVQFIHETVRTTLLAAQTFTTEIATRNAFNFGAPSCHSVLAELCLQYLIHTCEIALLNPGSRSLGPFAQYAASCWWQHMSAIGGSDSNQIIDLAVVLLTKDRGNIHTLRRVFDIENNRLDDRLFFVEHYTEEHAPSPIYYAAMVGLPALVTRMLDLGVDVNAIGGKYNSALQAASVRGHALIVQKLLAAGAKVDLPGGQYGNALVAAIENGHKTIAQMLVSAYADLDPSYLYAGSALTAASASGNNAIFSVVFDACRRTATSNSSLRKALVAARNVMATKSTTEIAMKLDQAIQETDPSSKMITIRVNTLSGRWITLFVLPETSGNDIKGILRQLTEVPPDQICLLATTFSEVNGRPWPSTRKFCDEECLFDRKIVDGTRFDIVLQYCVGS